MNCSRGPVPPNTRDRVKWLRLAALPERDAQSESVRHLAGLLFEAAQGNRRRFIALCHALARDGVPYVSDVQRTGYEDIAGITRPYDDPLEVLEHPDDCDAKARLLVALLLAGGLGARLVPWWDNTNGDLDHVSAEVMLDGRWVNLETILARARIGDVPQQVPVEKGTGKWLYT